MSTSYICRGNDDNNDLSVMGYERAESAACACALDYSADYPSLSTLRLSLSA
jgi:hypothetical protein